jgi:predicted RecA/RadA family phage recombinase
MATATYKRGEVRTIMYTAGADIAVDEVVICGVINAKKCRVGVAREAISNGSTGIVAVSGVFEFPKVSTAVIKAGESVCWDASAASGAGAVEDNAHSTGAGDVGEFGAAMADAGNGTTTVDVDIAEPGTYDAA